MPSPIAHAAAGFAIYRLWPKKGGATRPIRGVVPPMLAACVALSLLPDMDAAVGILLGDLGRFHNNFTSSPVFGTLVALCVGGVVRLFRKSTGAQALLLTFVCYQTHILMDFFTMGRGLMLLWPISSQRVTPPIHLFFGLRWSHGVVSSLHFVTLFTELAFAAALVLGLELFRRRRHARDDSPKDGTSP